MMSPGVMELLKSIHSSKIIFIAENLGPIGTDRSPDPQVRGSLVKILLSDEVGK